MRLIKSHLLFHSFLLLGFQTTTYGIPSTEFVPVFSGYFNDYELDGFTTYALRVTSDEHDWTNADLQIDLDSGLLNHIQNEYSFDNGPSQGIWGLGDTGTFAPNYSLGDITSGSFQQASHISDYHESDTSFRSHWFNTDTDDFGTFDIAMFTISNNANGTLAYRTIAGYLHDDGPGGYGAATTDYNIVNGKLIAFHGTPAVNPYAPPPNPPEPPVLNPSQPSISDPPFKIPGNASGHMLSHTEFVPVSTGRFDDAELNGYTTYAMRVSTGANEWTNADLSVQLTSGTLNHIEPESFGSNSSILGFGDTGVFAPTVSTGDLTNGNIGSLGIAGTLEKTPTSFEASWFTTESNDFGIFDIAMVTLSDDANGTLSFRTMSGDLVEDGASGPGMFLPDYEIINGQLIAIDPITLLETIGPIDPVLESPPISVPTESEFVEIPAKIYPSPPESAQPIITIVEEPVLQQPSEPEHLELPKHEPGINLTLVFETPVTIAYPEEPEQAEILILEAPSHEPLKVKPDMESMEIIIEPEVIDPATIESLTGVEIEIEADQNSISIELESGLTYPLLPGFGNVWVDPIYDLSATDGPESIRFYFNDNYALEDINEVQILPYIRVSELAFTDYLRIPSMGNDHLNNFIQATSDVSSYPLMHRNLLARVNAYQSNLTINSIGKSNLVPEPTSILLLLLWIADWTLWLSPRLRRQVST